jgi:branched-subunit amino acid ABC-type transport system permease component
MSAPSATPSQPTVAPLRPSFTESWFYKFILFPLGQMLIFIVGVSLILTIIMYGLAGLTFWVPTISNQDPSELVRLFNRQLPGTIISGIGIGFVYAMIALGYTLVYGVLKFINFAHSEIFMVGSVTGFALMEGIRGLGLLNNIPPFVLILVLIVAGMIVSGLLAVTIEVLAYRPLRGSPRLVPLITAIGISFILQDTVRAIAAFTINDFNLTYPTQQLDWLSNPTSFTINGVVADGFNIGGTSYTVLNDGETAHERFQMRGVEHDTITVGGVTFGGEAITRTRIRDLEVNGERLQTPLLGGVAVADLAAEGNVVKVRITVIVIVICSVLMLLFLNWFVNGTKWGRAIRAVSQDQATAGLMGINVNQMISLTFFLGGAFGGAAGVLFGMNAGTINPYVGFFPGLKAFIAAVLGGIGNLTGALLGGLALGLIEAYLNSTLVYFPAFGQRYTDIFAFLVLILVLIFRPNGILGEKVDEKV